MKEEFEEAACECQSPYHWMYDWCVNERDRKDLRAVLYEHSSLSHGEKTIAIQMRELASPKDNVFKTLADLSEPDSTVKTEYSPYRIEARDEFGEPRFEARFTLGKHGCWLCEHCCILEQLFPTPGVGCVGVQDQLQELVMNQWITCDHPEHELNNNRILALFRDELLEACIARFKLLTAIKLPYTDRGILPTREDLDVLLHDCFLPASRDKEKKRGESAATQQKDIITYEIDNMEEDEVIEDILEEHDGETMDGRGSYLTRLACAVYPPYPVKHHEHFDFRDSDFVERSDHGIVWEVFFDSTGDVYDPSLNLSISVKREKALAEHSTMSMQQSFSGRTSDYLKAVKTDGVWTIEKIDAVSRTIKIWNTSTAPLTPPRSPTRAPELVHITPYQGRQSSDILSPSNDIPRWMFAEFFSNYVRGEFGRARPKMVALPSADGITAAYGIETLARTLSYEQLYAASRMRRIADKYLKWKQMGFTDSEIQLRLTVMSETATSQETRSQVPSSVPSQTPIPLRDDSLRYQSGMGSFIGQSHETEEDLQTRLEADKKRMKRLINQDKHLIVTEMCDLCNKDFAVWYCAHHDKFYCEACDKGIHSHGEAANHIRLKPRAKLSPLAEEGGTVGLRSMDVYTVTVLVIIFLIYPSLMKELAMMLTCTDAVCVDLERCHRFLEEDPSIDCEESKYKTYRTLSFFFFFLYGFGLPLAGLALLYRNLDALCTKEVMSTLGFLYSGYRLKRWYWEMIIMIRKMLIVFIVVFLARNAEYQMWAAMWTIAFFLSLNVLLRPFKFVVLWKLESLSLVCIMTTLNLGLFYFADLSKMEEDLLTYFILAINVIVLLTFVINIVREVLKEIYAVVDKDGDGNMSCQEIRDYAILKWNEKKPDCLQSRTDVRREIRDMGRRQNWLAVDINQRNYRNKRLTNRLLDSTALYGYWSEYCRDAKHAKNRFAILQALCDKAHKTHSTQRRNFTQDELGEWWPVCYGETLEPNPLLVEVNSPLVCVSSQFGENSVLLSNPLTPYSPPLSPITSHFGQFLPSTECFALRDQIHTLRSDNSSTPPQCSVTPTTGVHDWSPPISPSCGSRGAHPSSVSRVSIPSTSEIHDWSPPLSPSCASGRQSNFSPVPVD